MTQNRKIYLERFIVYSLIVGVWFFFFWPMISGAQIAGYRDSSYLYYPMFEWITQQINAGHFPLWMPFDESGFPLLADGTSSMLYPGKLVFHLPFLSFPARYGTYLAMHVLLAACATYTLARTIGAGRWGACLAAISYAFGGSIVFQVCNVIYLVSAAWLPVALMCVWKIIENHSTTSLTWSIGASFACTMMILGGDPQMVYHVGLITLATILMRFARMTISAEAGFNRSLASIWRPLIGLAVMVVVTSGLSAAQLLPTIEWASMSDRSSASYPVNIYDSGLKNVDQLAANHRTPPMSDVYQFSLEPWSAIELIWANVFGKDAPVNTRWTAAFPGAERVWMPSIYFGAISFLLALSGIRLWSSQKNRLRAESVESAEAPLQRCPRVWLSWIGVWFFISAFGWYGPAWLFHELTGAAPDDLHRGAGGFYWLMVIALPKYFLFRYPAKLFVIAALAMCLLAGVQLTRLQRKYSSGVAKTTPPLNIWTIVLTISCLGMGAMYSTLVTDAIATCQSWSLFGPFQNERCIETVFFTFLKTAVISIAMLIVIWLCHRRSKAAKFFPLMLVLLTAIDLSISNRWMLHLIDADVLTSPTQIGQTLMADRVLAGISPDEVLVIDRRDQSNDYSEKWFEASSDDRIAQIATWRRESLFPKTHLSHLARLDTSNLQLLGSFCSIMPDAYDHPDKAYSSVIGDGFVTPLEQQPKLIWSKSPQPLAWLERDAEPYRTLSVKWIDNQFEIEIPAPAKNDGPNQASVVGLRILNMPGWRAHFIDPEGRLTAISIVTHGRYRISIEAPKREGKIVLSYQPRSFFTGVAISCAAFTLTSAMLIVIFFRRRPHKFFKSGLT